MRCGVWGSGHARRDQGRSGEDGEPALRVAKNLVTTRMGIHAAAPSNGGEFEGAVNEAAADATRAEANAKDEARRRPATTRGCARPCGEQLAHRQR